MLFKNAGGNKNVRSRMGAWDLLLASSSLARGGQEAPSNRLLCPGSWGGCDSAGEHPLVAGSGRGCV